MAFYSYILFNLHKIIPFFIVLILSIVSVSPIMPNGSEEIAPLLGVISLAFWIVYKPDLMGFLTVIIIGVFNDALYGSMLGVSCLAMIMIRVIIIKLLLKIDYINIYITFLSIGVSLIIWLTIHSMFKSILYFDLYNFYSLIFQFLISIALSPVIIFVQLFLLKKMNNS